MLRTRVIDVAIGEINNRSDITIGYSIEKEGRRVSTLLFNMEHKEKSPARPDAIKILKDKLKSFNLKSNLIKRLLERHDESYLWANISVVEELAKSGKIKNKAGYLLKAFEDDYTQSSRKENLKEDSTLAIDDSVWNEEKTKQKAFEVQRETIIKTFLKSLSSEEQHQLEQDFITDKSDSVLYQNLSKNKEFSHPLIQSIYVRYIAVRHFPEKWHSYETFKAS